MSDADTELREELLRLRAVVARRLRERLEGKEPVTPAFLDQARRFLLDQLKPEIKPRAPAVTRDLPFLGDDNDQP